MTVRDPRILKIKTVDDMTKILLDKGRPLDSFKPGDTIEVWNKMKKGYSYRLSVAPGTQMAFKPYATPGEMLALGAFEGKYLNDCLLEFPAEWYWNAILAGKLRPGEPDVSVNLLVWIQDNPFNSGLILVGFLVVLRKVCIPSYLMPR